jgi:hypothetical protein
MDIRDNTRSPLSADGRTVPAGRDLRDDRMEGTRDVPDVRTASERAAMRGGGAGGDEPSIADLIKNLRDESTTLIRQELALARTEISEKASKAGRNAAYTGVGALLLYLGLFFGLVALAAGVALLINGPMGFDPHGWWLGPLIVAAVVGGIGAAMTSKGIKTLKGQSFVPEKTVQSLKEDKQFIQDKVSQ